jgi:hypothetical protein
MKWVANDVYDEKEEINVVLVVAEGVLKSK